MQVETIISLVVLGVVVVAGLVSIIIAIVRGDMKKFIIEKMEEAEKLELSGEKKLEYVLQALKEKYKVLQLLINARKFIESIIAITKQINVK